MADRDCAPSDGGGAQLLHTKELISRSWAAQPEALRDARVGLRSRLRPLKGSVAVKTAPTETRDIVKTRECGD